MRNGANDVTHFLQKIFELVSINAEDENKQIIHKRISR